METLAESSAFAPELVPPPAATTLDGAIERALTYLQSQQAESGAWCGDYGGPLFLLPLYIGTCYGTGVEIPPAVLADMVRYLRNTQNADGGWGLHVESHSYQFTSVIIYVALRLADVPASDPDLVRARAFVRAHGGPLTAASWGKSFLTLLNLYDYRGLNPVQPELWLLPRALPFHPSRLWCQTRMIYLPMSYLYARRVQRPVDTRIRELRDELYSEPYDTVDWESAKDRVAASDDYTPLSPLSKLVHRVLSAYEQRALAPLRERALAFVLEQVAAEDRNTDYLCIAPVNKLYHMWVWHHARPGGPELARHRERLPEYLWQAEDGTKVQGYHSSQLWDTAFATQSMLATGELERCRSSLQRAHDFIDDNQVQSDLPEREKFFRDPTKGGWGFSSKDNTWITSDCTADGLRAALALAPLVTRPIPHERLRDALNYLLWSQTPSGGWATYEPARGPAWLERLNVSNVFSDVMIDYPYVECTASVMLALAAYRERFPGECTREIGRAIERGRDFLFAQQRADGSFEGSWGICFTYGTWFGLEGMRAAGLTADHERVRRACHFLEQHQLPDGGWGESAESCYRRHYVHTEQGQCVMTSWALLGLVAGGRATSPSAQRGARFLVARQREDGSYPPEHIAGIFSKTCTIHYDNYLKVFPLWALAELRRQTVQRA
ncbi:MAG: squalene--hopene cyclase [Myxococcaceae bacterium]|nr:squalene--hopene cyclase [Myxococcaceae bacterium]